MPGDGSRFECFAQKHFSEFELSDQIFGVFDNSFHRIAGIPSDNPGRYQLCAWDSYTGFRQKKRSTMKTKYLTPAAICFFLAALLLALRLLGVL